MTFKDLHNQDIHLLIYNVWDVSGVKLAEKLNFTAVGTSSSAIAAMLGYEDGEEMTFSELEFIVSRIVKNTRLPVSVDLEGGYSRNPDQIVTHIKRLAKLGVVGINLEDSVVDKKRELLDSDQFANMLHQIKQQLKKEQVEMFINVRTDAFLLGYPSPVEESVKRVKMYENAGADGIFTPCIVQPSDIELIVDCTNLPVNVMCMPALPDFKVLANLGVKRISMGNFLFNYANSELEKVINKVFIEGTFKSIF